MIRSLAVAFVVAVLSGCSCSDEAAQDAGTGGGQAGTGGGVAGGGAAGGAAGGSSTGGGSGGSGGGAACSAATTCNGHGTCNANGSCACAAGFTGAACASCAADFFAYPACTFCSAATTCNGHGTCSATGACTCAADFSPDAGCGACTADHYNYPACSFCSAATTCNGHGTCAANGGCACATGFADAGCGECAPGFSGFPACLPPVVAPLTADVIHKGPYSPDLAFSADGGIYLAHSLVIGGFNFRLVVSQLSSDAGWQQLGDQVDDDGGAAYTSFRPSLLNTAQGPLAIWSNNLRVLTRYFDGALWQPIAFGAAPVTVPGGVQVLDAVSDSLGRPVAVYIPSTADGVQTRRLENGVWAPLGTPFSIPASGVKIAIRPDDTVVAVVSTYMGFGTGITVLEQTPAGVWSVLGTPTFDAIGDTTQQLVLGDVDVTATETVVSWNKGTCNAFPRFIARPPSYTSFGPPNAVGNDVSQIFDGTGLIESFQPNCVSQMRALQRWNGTTWGPEVPVPLVITHGDLYRRGATLYMGYWNGASSLANVGVVNLP